MGGINDGRVVIVTGGGRGLGRSHALLFAREGAKVVVNDLGGDVTGEGGSLSPAQEVVDEIRASGGEAVVNGEDVSSFEGAQRLVAQAVDEFGRLDVLVNNAGILRDRMLINMTEGEWDSVIKVHLKGTFGPSHFAANHWRDRTKAGETNDARIINTSSAAGLYGNPGQTNYGAAKAGIAAFTVIASRELERYGVTCNAIAPGARTRMTESLGFFEAPADAAAFDASAPENISPLVVWLGSPLSKAISGRVFNVAGGTISVAEGWHKGPEKDKGDRWEPAELTDVVTDLVDRALPLADLFG